MSESEAGTAAVSKVVYSSGWSALVILAFGQLALLFLGLVGSGDSGLGRLAAEGGAAIDIRQSTRYIELSNFTERTT